MNYSAKVGKSYPFALSPALTISSLPAPSRKVNPDDVEVSLISSDTDQVPFKVPLKCIKLWGNLAACFAPPFLEAEKKTTTVIVGSQVLEKILKVFLSYSPFRNLTQISVFQQHAALFQSFPDLMEVYRFGNYYHITAMTEFVCSVTRNEEYLKNLNMGDLKEMDSGEDAIHRQIVLDLLFYKAFHEKKFELAAEAVNSFIQDFGCEGFHHWLQQNSFKEEALPFLIETILTSEGKSNETKERFFLAVGILKLIGNEIFRPKMALPIVSRTESKKTVFGTTQHQSNTTPSLTAIPQMNEFSNKQNAFDTSSFTSHKLTEADVPPSNASSLFVPFFFAFFRASQFVESIEAASQLFDIFSPKVNDVNGSCYFITMQEKSEFERLKIFAAHYLKRKESVIITISFQKILVNFIQEGEEASVLKLTTLWRNKILELEPTNDRLSEKEVTTPPVTSLLSQIFEQNCPDLVPLIREQTVAWGWEPIPECSLTNNLPIDMIVDLIEQGKLEEAVKIAAETPVKSQVKANEFEDQLIEQIKNKLGLEACLAFIKSTKKNFFSLLKLVFDFDDIEESFSILQTLENFKDINITCYCYELYICFANRIGKTDLPHSFKIFQEHILRLYPHFFENIVLYLEQNPLHASYIYEDNELCVLCDAFLRSKNPIAPNLILEFSALRARLSQERGLDNLRKKHLKKLNIGIEGRFAPDVDSCILAAMLCLGRVKEAIEMDQKQPGFDLFEQAFGPLFHTFPPQMIEEETLNKLLTHADTKQSSLMGSFYNWLASCFIRQGNYPKALEIVAKGANQSHVLFHQLLFTLRNFKNEQSILDEIFFRIDFCNDKFFFEHQMPQLGATLAKITSKKFNSLASQFHSRGLLSPLLEGYFSKNMNREKREVLTQLNTLCSFPESLFHANFCVNCLIDDSSSDEEEENTKDDP